MHLPAHFCSLKDIDESTLQDENGNSTLDFDSFQPVNAGGLLTVLWRGAPGVSVDIKPDTQYKCNLAPLTIPAGFRRIAHLRNWPSVEAERYPNRLATIPGDEEAGSIYLLDSLTEYSDADPNDNCVQNTIGRFHPCKNKSDSFGFSPYDIAHEGVNGRPCANPMRSRGRAETDRSRTRTSVPAASPYVVVEWNWKEYYPFPDGLTSAAIRHIHMLRLFWGRDTICLVGMVIPGGTVVWVPIFNKTIADRADTELRKDPLPDFVLKRPKFIDGPDIFVAGCNFKPR